MALHRPSPSGASTGSELWGWLGIALIAVFLDQLSKTLILRHFADGDSRFVTSFFNVVRVHNHGAAFRFLADESGWQRWFFVGLGLVVSTGIIWMLDKHPAQRLFSFAIAMILGGALGNVIDRLWHGYVVDFIQLHYADYAFPSFNLADSAITLGAICLVLDELIRVRRS